MKKILPLLFVWVLLCSNTCLSDEISLNGQAVGYFAYDDVWKAGFRYIPEMKISHILSEQSTIDAEISLNAYTWSEFEASGNFIDNAKLKLYRSWIRYSRSQFETRVGLQKINFGPAKIMRTLMWFDSVDVSDPLGLTDGVYGVLGRYYFLNNANIWVWGLYGNDDLKGLEEFKSDKDGFEFGTRCQVPVPKGEVAFSFNRRSIDAAYWNAKRPEPMSEGSEYRYAIDGEWDVGIGLWFEASLEDIEINSSARRWRKMSTLGGDYTFESGIHLTGEHFIALSGSRIFRTDKRSNVSAISLDYNFSFIDNIRAIGYYDRGREKIDYYLGWSRTYDDWQLVLSVFSDKDEADTFKGTGAQCMVIYNY